MLDVRCRRVYEQASPDDGLRVLVDRVWPRGMAREQVRADHWLTDIAPSAELRTWFGHDRARWTEFRRRYFAELDARPQVVAMLLAEAASGRVTLLFISARYRAQPGGRVAGLPHRPAASGRGGLSVGKHHAIRHTP
jgi:uncharacterized protein YeaO (DUF488 family)